MLNTLLLLINLCDSMVRIASCQEKRQLDIQVIQSQGEIVTVQLLLKDGSVCRFQCRWLQRNTGVVHVC